MTNDNDHDNDNENNNATRLPSKRKKRAIGTPGLGALLKGPNIDRADQEDRYVVKLEGDKWTLKDPVDQTSYLFDQRSALLGKAFLLLSARKKVASVVLESSPDLGSIVLLKSKLLDGELYISRNQGFASLMEHYPAFMECT